MTQIVTVTKKGQATIPKALREKAGIEGKAMVRLTEGGVLFTPVPDPLRDYGCLRKYLRGEEQVEGILKEDREAEERRERHLMGLLKR